MRIISVLGAVCSGRWARGLWQGTVTSSSRTKGYNFCFSSGFPWPWLLPCMAHDAAREKPDAGHLACLFLMPTPILSRQQFQPFPHHRTKASCPPPWIEEEILTPWQKLTSSLIPDLGTSQGADGGNILRSCCVYSHTVAPTGKSQNFPTLSDALASLHGHLLTFASPTPRWWMDWVRGTKWGILGKCLHQIMTLSEHKLLPVSHWGFLA